MVTWLLTIALAVGIVAVVVNLVQQAKQGKHLSCGGNCDSCPYHTDCKKESGNR